MENNEQMPAEVGGEAKPLKKGSKKMGAVVTAIVLLLVIVGGVAGVMWEVTVKHASGAAIRKISELLPIPAARVGGKTILYREYLKSRDTLITFLNSDAAKTQGINTKLDTDMEKNVLEKLVNQAALEELAEQKKITVNDEELRAFFADVVAAASTTTPDVGVYLLKNFGWDEENFRQEVLKPALLEQHVGIALAQEKQGDPNALQTYMTDRLSKPDVVRYLRF